MTSSAPKTARNDLAGVAVGIDDRDEQPAISTLAIGGVVAALVLAAIGGFPLDTPMPTHAFGWVSPTCGLTRGSTAIARGDFGVAWHYNPLAFAVMAFGAFGIVRYLAGITTRRWLTVHLHLGRHAWYIAAAAILVFWLYQQQHAEFIIHARI